MSAPIIAARRRRSCIERAQIKPELLRRDGREIDDQYRAVSEAGACRRFQGRDRTAFRAERRKRPDVDRQQRGDRDGQRGRTFDGTQRRRASRKSPARSPVAQQAMKKRPRGAKASARTCMAPFRASSGGINGA